MPADPDLPEMSIPTGVYRLIEHRAGGRPLDWVKVADLLEPKWPAPICPSTPITPSTQDAAIRGLVQTILYDQKTGAWRTQEKDGRNNALYYAGRRAAEHIAAGRLDHTYAYQHLTDAALSTNLPSAEIAVTLRSAMGNTR